MVYAVIYTLLTVGALTMVYPLALMVSGSFNSTADETYITPYPRFWFDDTILFHKYVESKYNTSVDLAENTWQQKIGSWRNIKPNDLTNAPPYFKEYMAWRMSCPWWELGHTYADKLYFINARLWRQALSQRFNGDLAAFRQAFGLPVRGWQIVNPPPPPATRFAVVSRYRQDFRAFAESRPVMDRIIVNLDGYYWKGYLQPRYTADIKEYNRAHGTDYGTYSRLLLDTRIPGTSAADTDWVDFVREELNHPSAGGTVPRANDIDVPSGQADAFRAYLAGHYQGDIARLNAKYKVHAASFESLRLRLATDEWQEFVVDRFRAFLQARYGTVERLNAAYGTRYGAWTKIPILAIVRDDWQDYVRSAMRVRYVRVDINRADAYRRFLRNRHGTIERLNQAFGSAYASFDDISFSGLAPDATASSENLASRQLDWDAFLKDRAACPAEDLMVYGPRQAFEDYLKDQGIHISGPVRLPLAYADYVDCLAHHSELRREFTTRNYKHVLEYLLFHGRGAFNTLLYVILAIVSHLVVNPLAAYALSRYKPRHTYQILLFCMATMAFPAEVTMIPNFLLLRRFPLWPLLGGSAVFGVVLWGVTRLFPRLPLLLRTLIALIAGSWVGAHTVPSLMGAGTVSLLNTFAALILPGMASGFSIFLLKGFFDSLPADLYEAAALDGASEFRMFWTLTMSLSKPILAVIALGAFTHAYGNFMMALVTVPDQRMWTLMVWIFQLRSQAHQAVMYASLVLAAIPTVLVFIICQNLILRGIIVPTER